MDYLIYQGKRYYKPGIPGHPAFDEAGSKNKKEAKAYIRHIKLSSQCIKCGESRPWCLTFHHRDKTKKFMGIPAMIGKGFPIDLIKRELNKCDCLCANDHQEIHFRKYWIKIEN